MCPCNSNSRKHRWLKKTCSGSPFTHCDALWPFFLHWELVLLASHVNDWMFFYKRPNWIWNTDPKVFHSSILTTTVTPTSILWPSCQLLGPNFIPHLKHLLHWHQEVLWGGALKAIPPIAINFASRSVSRPHKFGIIHTWKDSTFHEGGLVKLLKGPSIMESEFAGGCIHKMHPGTKTMTHEIIMKVCSQVCKMLGFQTTLLPWVWPLNNMANPKKLVEKHPHTEQPAPSFISFASQVALLGEQPSVTILGHLNPVCWLQVIVLLWFRWWCRSLGNKAHWVKG